MQKLPCRSHPFRQRRSRKVCFLDELIVRFRKDLNDRKAVRTIQHSTSMIFRLLHSPTPLGTRHSPPSRGERPDRPSIRPQ